MSQTKAQLIDPTDGSIVNADINASAAIAGTKISPNFGSQNIVTTGTLGSGDITITGGQPALKFIDDGANPDYNLYNNNGVLRLYDITNAADRLVVNTDGHIDVTGHLDVGSGLDVTGAITGTSDLTIDTNTLHVDASNNRVGIGTTSPTQIFHVKNTGSHTTWRIENDNADFLIQAGDSGADGLHFYDFDNSAYRMTIANSGKVGIGTTSPSSLLNIDGGSSNALVEVDGSGQYRGFEIHESGTRKAYFHHDLTNNLAILNTVENALAFHIGDTENMRLTTNGLGIGSSNPQYKLHVLGGNTDQVARFENNRTGDGNINYIGIGLASGTTGSALFGHTGHSTAASQAAWFGLGGDDVAGGQGVKCFKGGAVQMNGTLRVNSGTQYGKIHSKESSFNPNTSTWLTNVSYVASSSFGGGYALLDGTKGYTMYCHGSGSNFAIQHHSSTTATASGGVQLLNAATSWSSASDEREKENLVTISDAITKIKTLRTVTGNYTWQPDVKHAFLIAQDVQAVLPEAVDIRNTYEETEKQRLGLRYTEVIPLLTAALKEAVAEIDTLKTKVAALEAA